jgi:hypothetical protein
MKKRKCNNLELMIEEHLQKKKLKLLEEKNESECKENKKIQSLNAHIAFVTSSFVRNSENIKKLLTVLISGFIIMNESTNIVKFVRFDKKRMLKLSFWTPHIDRQYFCFTDLNKDKHDIFYPGYYQYQVSTNNIELLCNLMIPLAVELAACPSEWTIEYNDEEFSVINFGRMYCDVFIY